MTTATLSAPAALEQDTKRRAQQRTSATPATPKPIAEAVNAKALQLHDETLVLLGEAGEMDDAFGHATCLIDLAVYELSNTLVREGPVKWNAGARKTDALVRGALTVGDATPGQAIILQRCLTSIAGLCTLTDGVTFESEGEALEAIVAGTNFVEPLQTRTADQADDGSIELSSEQAATGVEAACSIAAIASLLSEQLEEARAGVMEASRFRVLHGLAVRTEALANVTLSLFVGDLVTAEGIALVNGGAA